MELLRKSLSDTEDAVMVNTLGGHLDGDKLRVVIIKKGSVYKKVDGDSVIKKVYEIAHRIRVRSGDVRVLEKSPEYKLCKKEFLAV